jgi:hypothetical protein
LPRDNHNDWYTIAAIGLLAMCLVTFDHEALGHGGMCLALGGHIKVLTSSIFRCSLHSVWIDPAGPCANLLAGTLSLLMGTWIPRRLTAARLFLILVASFSFFWEAGYLIKAMLVRDGDLYFAAEDFVGEPSLWWRIAGVAAGIILYLAIARWASRALTGLFPDDHAARRVARVAWVAASLGAAVAAVFHVAGGWPDFRDAVLEIGASSIPLLLIAPRGRISAAESGPAPIRRSGLVMCLSLAIYAVFVATLGRGLYF